MGIKNGKWITSRQGYEAPVFLKLISCSQDTDGLIELCGLGWFELYVNGEKVSGDMHTPGVSSYVSAHEINKLVYPLSDVTSKRAYCLSYPIELKKGENRIEFLLGNGFYNQSKRTAEGDMSFGSPMLIYSITADGQEFLSDEDTLVGKSVISENNLYFGEKQDLSGDSPLYAKGAELENAVPAKPFSGELSLWEFPKDRVIREIEPRLISRRDGVSLYDAGENISGIVSFDSVSAGRVILRFSEEISGEELDFKSCGGERQIQQDEFIFSEKKIKNAAPHFTWHGFRYFTLEGEAENVLCKVIHTDVKVTSSFKCENRVINRLYDAYIRSQLGNYHGCIPSDCPHRERLGYTGDGQITAETAMLLIDSKDIYKKWMRDIVDSQNTENGHVQHTAPFFGGGGGPCGWGGAIALVPYYYYKVTGSAELTEAYLDNILKWFSYIDSRSDKGLVVREEEKGWCLGDWCIPTDREEGSAALSIPFVNTCYFIKCLQVTAETLKALGKTELSSELALKAERHKAAVNAAFFDEADGNYCGNLFGANAYAIDIGLGDERTAANLISHYEKAKGFDTGIFGTEIVTGILCGLNRADIAFRLMSSKEKDCSFGYWFEQGATTLWEEFDGSNSHNHHMFGSCVKLLFTEFLGIKQLAPGYKRVKIEPAHIPELGNTEGHITTPYGKIAVSVKRNGTDTQVSISAPDEIEIVK